MMYRPEICTTMLAMNLEMDCLAHKLFILPPLFIKNKDKIYEEKIDRVQLIQCHEQHNSQFHLPSVGCF